MKNRYTQSLSMISIGGKMKKIIMKMKKTISNSLKILGNQIYQKENKWKTKWRARSSQIF